MNVARLTRILLRVAVSLTLLLAILWSATALWIDGPQSRYLAGTLAGGVVLTAGLMALLIRPFWRAAVIILVAARLLFDVQVQGSYLALFIATLVYLFGALGFGLLITNLLGVATGPWIAGIDFPFGQSRRFVENIGWPDTWTGYVDHVGRMSREGFRRALDDYRRPRAIGWLSVNWAIFARKVTPPSVTIS